MAVNFNMNICIIFNLNLCIDPPFIDLPTWLKLVRKQEEMNEIFRSLFRVSTFTEKWSMFADNDLICLSESFNLNVYLDVQ